MSLPLLHSPADIARWLLIAKPDAALTVPSLQLAWPAFNDTEPSAPDNCVTIYDDQATDDGRAMRGGESFEHYGVQVRVRAVTKPIGLVKAEALKLVMTEQVYRDEVILDGTHYLVQCFAKNGGVLRLGMETPTSKRHLFVINALMSLTRTS